MFFAISCIDKAGYQEVRLENRAAHLDYLKSRGDAVKLAGPYTSERGDAMTGSLIVLEAPDRASAQAFAAGDPYALAGLFESVDIRPWKWVVGNPEA